VGDCELAEQVTSRVPTLVERGGEDPGDGDEWKPNDDDHHEGEPTPDAEHTSPEHEPSSHTDLDRALDSYL
jgi:hypothetical protein